MCGLWPHEVNPGCLSDVCLQLFHCASSMLSVVVMLLAMSCQWGICSKLNLECICMCRMWNRYFGLGPTWFFLGPPILWFLAAPAIEFWNDPCSFHCKFARDSWQGEGNHLQSLVISTYGNCSPRRWQQRAPHGLISPFFLMCCTSLHIPIIRPSLFSASKADVHPKDWN